MAEKEYRRIAGRGFGRKDFITWVEAQLWMGKNHLLQIEKRGYTEKYKRFYYADIQAIIMRRTNSTLYKTVFLSLMIAFGVAWEFSITSGGAAIFWGSWIGFFALLLLLNLLKGPGCTCHIQTAIQTEQLPSFNRIKKTRKALTQLREAIAANQGLLSPEELRVRLIPGENVGGSVGTPDTAREAGTQLGS